jgi:hypothetical protein
MTIFLVGRTRMTWISLLILVGFIICWGILFWGMGKGYDFTDDAHYLIWASHPFIYPWSVSEFGVLWHPIYKLVGGDIKSFRLAGAAILSSSAAIFGWAVWRFVADRLPAACALPLILAITTSSFWAYLFWLPTPGYNDLNLCGLLLFSAGLTFAVPTAGSQLLRAGAIETAAKAAFTSFGACIIAFAKPTSAIGAGLIGLVWLIVFRPQRSLLFVGCVAMFSLIFFSAIVFPLDGNFQTFIQRKLTGVHMLAIHSPTHGLDAMWRSLTDPLVDLVTFPPIRNLMLVMLAIWFCWANLALWASIRLTRLVNFISFVIAVGVAIVVADWRIRGSATQEYYVALIAPMMLTIALALALTVKGMHSKDRRLFAIAAIAATLPMIFSVGSGTPAIYHASQASIFWFTAAIILAVIAPTEVRSRIFAGTVMFASSLTVGILVGAIADPYRLHEPMWKQTERVEIGALSSELLVDHSTASYIKDLQEAAAAHDFKLGMPIIDLTGASPGTVFALGGEAPGIPWLSGGYVGSPAYVRETLSRVPHEHLRQAWVLTTTGTDTVPDAVLRSLDLDFPHGYQTVGQACMGVPCVEHILWKPLVE